VTNAEPENVEPSIKKWKFLEARQERAAVAVRPADTAQSELSKYLIEVRSIPQARPVTDALCFWMERTSVYPLLTPLAQDLISAPASEAFVERIFSVCGILTAGRRNRMQKSLEMRVFLKLNSKFLGKH
jgi:hAT family C-terminal dimerisation region